SAQIREILISESAWEEMTCLFAPSLILINRKSVKELFFYRDELLFLSIGYTSFSSHPEKIDHERRRLAGRYSEK
ncbi:hypothetical protein AB7862_14330, partial [Klebsiella pneumoniae]